MANYRTVHVKMWSQGDIEVLSANARYLFVYLLTNSQRNESALYGITLRRIAFETALELEQVTAALEELDTNGKVLYDRQTSTTWVINAAKYQTLNKNCIKSIVNDLRLAPSRSLAMAFCEHYADAGALGEACRGLLAEWSKGEGVTNGLANPSEGVSKPRSDRQRPYIGVGVGLGLGQEGGVGETDAQTTHEPARNRSELERDARRHPTLDDALTHGTMAGVDERFVRWWHAQLVLAGFTDAEGRTVKSWQRYLKTCWEDRDPGWLERIERDEAEARRRQAREERRKRAGPDGHEPTETDAERRVREHLARQRERASHPGRTEP